MSKIISHPGFCSNSNLRVTWSTSMLFIAISCSRISAFRASANCSCSLSFNFFLSSSKATPLWASFISNSSFSLADKLKIFKNCFAVCLVRSNLALSTANEFLVSRKVCSKVSFSVFLFALICAEDFSFFCIWVKEVSSGSTSAPSFPSLNNSANLGANFLFIC